MSGKIGLVLLLLLLLAIATCQFHALHAHQGRLRSLTLFRPKLSQGAKLKLLKFLDKHRTNVFATG